MEIKPDILVLNLHVIMVTNYCNEIEKLFIRKLAGEATEKDIQKINKIIEQDPLMKLMYNDYVRIWNMVEACKNKEKNDR